MATPAALPLSVSFSMRIFCALRALSPWPCDFSIVKAMAPATIKTIAAKAMNSSPLCFFASPKTIAALLDACAEEAAELPEEVPIGGMGGSAAAEPVPKPHEPGMDVTELEAATFSAVLTGAAPDLECRC